MTSHCAYEFSDSGLIKADPPIRLDHLPPGWGAVEHIVSLAEQDSISFGRIRFQRTPWGTSLQTSPGIAAVVRDGHYIGITRVPVIA